MKKLLCSVCGRRCWGYNELGKCMNRRYSHGLNNYRGWKRDQLSIIESNVKK